MRGEVLARPAATRAPVTESELEVLRTLLGELNATWAARVGEEGVSWKIRRVKSLWGCCHWRDRYITYNAELAHAPRDLVEYVVVHEYTHFARPIAAACAVGLRPVDMSTTTVRSSMPSWTSVFRAGGLSGGGSIAASGARRARTRTSRRRPLRGRPSVWRISSRPVSRPSRSPRRRSPRPLLAYLPRLWRNRTRRGASRPLCRPSFGSKTAVLLSFSAITNFLKILCNLSRSRSYSGCKTNHLLRYERTHPMNKTIRNLAIAALFVFPGLSGFPQEVQQDETPAAQPVVEENVAFPILIGIP